MYSGTTHGGLASSTTSAQTSHEAHGGGEGREGCRGVGEVKEKREGGEDGVGGVVEHEGKWEEGWDEDDTEGASTKRVMGPEDGPVANVPGEVDANCTEVVGAASGYKVLYDHARIARNSAWSSASSRPVSWLTNPHTGLGVVVHPPNAHGRAARMPGRGGAAWPRRRRVRRELHDHCGRARRSCRLQRERSTVEHSEDHAPSLAFFDGTAARSERRTPRRSLTHASLPTMSPASTKNTCETETHVEQGDDGGVGRLADSSKETRMATVSTSSEEMPRAYVACGATLAAMMKVMLMDTRTVGLCLKNRVRKAVLCAHLTCFCTGWAISRVLKRASFALGAMLAKVICAACPRDQPDSGRRLCWNGSGTGNIDVAMPMQGKTQDSVSSTVVLRRILQNMRKEVHGGREKARSRDASLRVAVLWQCSPYHVGSRRPSGAKIAVLFQTKTIEV
ncbi:hypothetical protein B0H13DRAFT_1922562 [Mycena leptocephala]|nr:hypothetical protein B0H13DRAFT_1922562 [Mycena leptocephala]